MGNYPAVRRCKTVNPLSYVNVNKISFEKYVPPEFLSFSPEKIDICPTLLYTHGNNLKPDS